MDTKNLIYQQAKELFHRYGFKRVTISQVCQYAGVSRVTFYKFFANKDELIVAVLAEHVDASNQVFELFERSDISFQNKVRMLIEVKIEQTRQFESTLFSDFWRDPPPAVSDYINQKALEQRDRLSRMFLQAQAQGQIRSSITIDFIWYILEKTEPWFFDPRFRELFPKMEDQLEQLLNFLFFGVQGAPEPANTLPESLPERSKDTL